MKPCGIDAVIHDVHPGSIDSLRRMKVAHGLRDGDECPIGVELFDGPLCQADDVPEMCRRGYAEFRRQSPCQATHRQTIAVNQIRSDSSSD